MITRAAYRSHGADYSEPDRPSHIWTVAMPKVASGTEKPKQVTTGEFSESGLTWSRDGSKIYFVSNRVREPYYQPPDSGLYVVNATGGEVTEVASIDGPIGAISLSPDGRRIIAVSAEEGRANLKRIDAETGKA